MKTLARAAALTLAAALPAQAENGVTDTEVKIGGAHDLSGIFAPFSVPAVKAAQHYFDEINAAGGVHGRKITYIVEDHGYQAPKAMQAANKLINRDKIFAMFLALGTPHNIAAYKLQEKKNIPNFNPLSAARQMLISISTEISPTPAQTRSRISLRLALVGRRKRGAAGHYACQIWIASV